MAIRRGVISYGLWLALLTATAQGYKSCSEIQGDTGNKQGTVKIELGGKEYNIQCNMSSNPATAIVKVLNSKNVLVENPAMYSQPSSFHHKIDYGGIPVKAIQKLVELSESCKQFVSYKCKNATLFGDRKIKLSSWFTSEGDSKYYWGNCGAGDKPCYCDLGKNEEVVDQGFLTKKQDLPVSEVRFGGLKTNSNVSFTIGDIVCYGDGQEGSLTFQNRNSYVAVNLSRDEDKVAFKFKSSSLNRNKTIATFEMDDGSYAKIGLSNDMKLQISTKIGTIAEPHYLPDFMKVDGEWHHIMLEIRQKDLDVSIDGKKNPVIENRLDSAGARLVFGDPSHKCNSFIGCIKDLYIGDKDHTTQFQDSKTKEYVKEGCEESVTLKEVICSHSKLRGGSGSGGGGGGDGGGGGSNETGIKGDDDDKKKEIPREDGGDDNTAVIVIVVIFLLLLIVLLGAFFVTWYLKRNKGVYQTHEGSAENIHGDAENLTLVTKPSEQEPENKNSKEYYL